MRVFFNKLENSDLQGKVGFSSIKIYKSGCFAGFFLSARPGIDNKISKLSSKNIAIKQKMPIFAVRSSRRGNSSDETSGWFGSSAG